jgi:hypothetical protein
VVGTVTFNGPFAWGRQDGAPSVFDQKGHGIYLWTVPQRDGNHLVYYVGETGRAFAMRMEEHLKEHLSGFYHLYEPDAFQRGVKMMEWGGHWDADRKRSVDEIIENHSGLSGTIDRLMPIYRFFLASFDSEPRIRKRIEAAIAGHLYHQEGIVGGFQDKGIVYQPRKEEEEPFTVRIECPPSVLGVPKQISA